MKTAIVGMGNILMKDDGVGVHVVRALGERELPANVTLLDAGTDPDAAYEIADANRVIVIDAARGGEDPGTIYRLPDRVACEAVGVTRTCHDMSLLRTLRDSRQPDDPIEILVIGVEPRAIDLGLELSEVVAARVPHVVEVVLKELRGYRCS